MCGTGGVRTAQAAPALQILVCVRPCMVVIGLSARLEGDGIGERRPAPCSVSLLGMKAICRGAKPRRHSTCQASRVDSVKYSVQVGTRKRVGEGEEEETMGPRDGVSRVRAAPQTIHRALSSPSATTHQDGAPRRFQLLHTLGGLHLISHTLPRECHLSHPGLDTL